MPPGRANNRAAVCRREFTYRTEWDEGGPFAPACAHYRLAVVGCFPGRPCPAECNPCSCPGQTPPHKIKLYGAQKQLCLGLGPSREGLLFLLVLVCGEGGSALAGLGCRWPNRMPKADTMTGNPPSAGLRTELSNAAGIGCVRLRMTQKADVVMLDPSLTLEILPFLWLVSMILHCLRITQPLILKGTTHVCSCGVKNHFHRSQKRPDVGPRQLRAPMAPAGLPKLRRSSRGAPANEIHALKVFGVLPETRSSMGLSNLGAWRRASLTFPTMVGMDGSGLKIQHPMVA